jgi:hypothetical protein
MCLGVDENGEDDKVDFKVIVSGGGARLLLLEGVFVRKKWLKYHFYPRKFAIFLFWSLSFFLANSLIPAC